MSSLVRPLAPIVAFFLSLAMGACDVEEPSRERFVFGTTVIVDRSSSALTATSILGIEGTYGPECTAREGTWTIPFNGDVLDVGEQRLTVALRDSGCALAVTGITVGPEPAQRFLPASPFQLAATFPTTGVPFFLDGAGDTRFFATFRVTPDLEFLDDFTVEMVFSDDVNQTGIELNPGFIVVSSSGETTGVPAPNGVLSRSRGPKQRHRQRRPRHRREQVWRQARRRRRRLRQADGRRLAQLDDVVFKQRLGDPRRQAPSTYFLSIPRRDHGAVVGATVAHRHAAAIAGHQGVHPRDDVVVHHNVGGAEAPDRELVDKLDGVDALAPRHPQPRRLLGASAGPGDGALSDGGGGVGHTRASA
jgi:hypothetical protein